MSRCRRCDYRTDPELEQPERAQLVTHAVDAQHPLCIVDQFRSLAPHEARCCERCLTQAQQDLADVVVGYALLEGEIGLPKPPVLDRDGGRTDDGAALPGGNALLMLVGGSAGLDEDEDTYRDTDPVPVPHFLTTWEDDWRVTRREPAAVTPPGTGPLIGRTVVAAAGYLERHMRWAANTHDAFDDFARELRQVLARVQDGTQERTRPVVAPADCFECGGRLERDYRPPIPCAHRDHEPEACTVDQGGMSEDWTCADCHATYDQERYWLAVRARLEAS